MTQARYIGYSGQYLDVQESSQIVAGNNSFSGDTSFNRLTVTGEAFVPNPTMTGHALNLGTADTKYQAKTPALNLYNTPPTNWGILRVKDGSQEFINATDFGVSLLGLADDAAGAALLGFAQLTAENTFTANNKFPLVSITNSVASDGKVGNNLTAGDGLTIRGIKPDALTARRVTIDGDLYVTGILKNIVSGAPITVWNSDNQGSGSGMDSDKLDGHDASYFENLVSSIDLSPYYNKSQDTVTTGSLSVTKFLKVTDVAPTLALTSSAVGAFGVNVANTGTAFKVKKMTGSTELLVNGDSMMNLDLNTGNVRFAGDITAFSDLRLKTNVWKIENGLEVILGLNPVSYVWKENKKSDVGLIAQELESILPSLVDNSGEYKTVSYIKLIPYLIAAVKDLYAKHQKETT